MTMGRVFTFFPTTELAIFWMAGGINVLSGCLKKSDTFTDTEI